MTDTPAAPTSDAPAPEGSLGAALYPNGAVPPAAETGPGPPEPVAAITDPVVPPEPAAEPAPVADPAPADPAPVALTPESYSALALPETITVSAPLLSEYKTLAAELNIPPEAAQKLADFYGKVATDNVKATTDAWAATQAAWTSTINAMPEFQGEARSQSEAMLGTAIDEFGDPSVREFFRMTGDHPGVAKMILNMARALVEDSPTPAGKPGTLASPSGKGQGKTLGSILYPTQTN